MNYLILATGGAIGTILRYLLVNASIEYFRQPVFPWGTLLVNLVGSLVIGLLAGMNESDLMNPGMKIFLFIGLLGGFTTFSSFSLETFHLIRQSQVMYAIAYVLSSTLLGLLLAATGYFISKWTASLLS
ncbi:MAG TPA: fluoride efflux transporter CrcB [Bacteroidia bacterium]|nr:fluoride efflux transporter CrcB [Bacteroidia bacterium]